MDAQTALSQALKSRLDSLRIRYPSYSLRAFAKKAGVSPATMSLIIQGKRPVSQKLAANLCEKLGFDPQERSEILKISLTSKTTKSSEQFIQLSLDQYRLISDWKAFAILNLIKTANFQNDPKWIASRLDLTVHEVEESILHLQRLDMINISGKKMTRTVSKYSTTEDVVNLSLQRSHSQTLELAQAALENIPVPERDYTWITLPVDPTKMKKAKVLIRKFQDDFAAQIEEDGIATEVYRLAIQYFPLTKLSQKRDSK